MDIEDIKKLLQKEIDSLAEPKYPDALDDARLEDAFKSPICDDEGYAPHMLAIWNSFKYGETPDGVKILSYKSASTASDLYSKYLNEEAIVWDSAKQELFLYTPDIEHPAIAFKGSNWLCAKKLKAEYSHLNIYDVYMELLKDIKNSI